MEPLFKNSALKIEGLINKLEGDLGLPHKSSPLQSYLQNLEKEKKQKNQEKQKPNKKKQKENEERQKKRQAKKNNKNDPNARAMNDFLKAEFRVGEFIKVWPHPESEKLYCEEINIGTEVRKIASGIRKFVPIEEMKGLCVVFPNVRPKNMPNYVSHGMMCCLPLKDLEGKEIRAFFRPRDEAKPGDRIFPEGHAEKFPEDAHLETIAPGAVKRIFKRMEVDAEGYITYNKIRLSTKHGYLKPILIK